MEVSFVNSINTSRGGTHVSYITDQAAVRRKEVDIFWDRLGFHGTQDFNWFYRGSSGIQRIIVGVQSTQLKGNDLDGGSTNHFCGDILGFQWGYGRKVHKSISYQHS